MHRTLLLLPLLLVSCGTDPAAAPPPATAPSTTGAASPGPSPTGSTTAPLVAVYWLGALQEPRGPRLYREWLPGAADPVEVALRAALAGTPADDDYDALWPEGTTLRSVEREGTTAVVDLSSEASDGAAGAAFEAASVQQLVHTVTANDPAVTAVRLLVEGEPVETLWGHVDLTGPVGRAPAAEVLGPVWLDVAEDAVVTGSFGGTATVFEATVSWRLLQGDRVVDEGFATASTGAPGRGAWTADLDAPPGDYLLQAYESSARDGTDTWVDSKRVRVA